VAPGATRSGVTTPQREERLHVVVRGHVQGVGFRWFVVHVAGSLGLEGWVRNRSDRSVELVAEGPSHRLDELLGALREGPPASAVDTLQVSRSPAIGGLGGFRIRSGDHPGD
jgi:acylphosphatase